MFTGLVESLARIVDIVPEPPEVLLAIDAGPLAKGAAVGDSVAVNGCCLTVVRIEGDTLSFQAGSETLSRTNLGNLLPGCSVNLERSLVLGDRLGGHLVTGHIDGVGALVERRDEGDWSLFSFRTSAELVRQVAPKGSIAVDGVSLTVVEVDGERFSVALIPHTLDVTTLGKLAVGGSVNLETDLIAKYVARQMQGRGDV